MQSQLLGLSRTEQNPSLEEEPSGFISKDSILGGLRRRVEVQGSPGHQEQGNTRKVDQGTAVHPQTSTTSRPEKWHGRAMVVQPGLCCFAIFCFGRVFHSAPFLFFPLALGLRERLERVLKT
uniref:Uncharacterized protein n=1 Tax=Opuntia streptacantha TaxID=393608 RepID=A0A7C8YQJ6_OPUST